MLMKDGGRKKATSTKKESDIRTLYCFSHKKKTFVLSFKVQMNPVEICSI